MASVNCLALNFHFTLLFTSFHFITGLPKAFLIRMTMHLFLHFPKAQLSPGCENWQNFTELKYNKDKKLKIVIRYHCTYKQWVMALHRGPLKGLQSANMKQGPAHLPPMNRNTFDHISRIWSQAPSTPLKCPWWKKKKQLPLPPLSGLLCYNYLLKYNFI